MVKALKGKRVNLVVAIFALSNRNDECLIRQYKFPSRLRPV